MANWTPRRDQRLALACLLEGMSLRATARVTGLDKATVAKLGNDAGKVAGAFQDKVLRGLPCKRIEVDEVWCFVYHKSHTVNKGGVIKCAPAGAGDIWTWVAIDPDTKLVPSWWIGDRSSSTLALFASDLAGRMAGRIQITSDGHGPYTDGVPAEFGYDGVDFAQLVKLYSVGEDEPTAEKVSPRARYKAHRKDIIAGNPDPALITTAHVERQNLTLRMCLRRYTRKTNAFSKRIIQHCNAVALNYFYYNFCRVHMTLECTPAMAAGLTDRAWTIDDLLNIVDGSRPAPKRPRRYKRHARRQKVA